MNTLLHEYHARLGVALEGDNRLAAIESLHAEMEQRIAALQPLVQPSMFPSGEDAPLFTLPEDAPAEPETRIEFAYYKLDPALVDVVADCIDYAWPRGTIAGCWAHLDKLLARGTLTQEDYDTIKAAGDFIIAD